MSEIVSLRVITFKLDELKKVIDIDYSISGSEVSNMSAFNFYGAVAYGLFTASKLELLALCRSQIGYLRVPLPDAHGLKLAAQLIPWSNKKSP